MYTNVTAPTTRMLGIDVSDFQGTVNWTNVKAAGISFAFTKATEGASITHSTLGANMTNARAAGVFIGAYHFARPNAAGTDAPAEAAYFSSSLAPYLLANNLRPVLDMEDSGGLSKAALSTWVNTFCSEVFRLTGVAPIIYTGLSFAETNLDIGVTKYPLWIAQYPGGTVNPQTASPASNLPWNTWHFWQYTDAGTVSGIAGNVDRNTMNGGTTALDQYKIVNNTSSIINGGVYNDANANGIFDGTDPAIAGRTVYLDLNGDGAPNADEPNAVTNASGQYAFNGLKPGAYAIRQVIPANWAAISPNPQTRVITGGTTNTVNLLARAIDVTPPSVTTFAYNRQNVPQRVTYTFTENVQATLSSSDLTFMRGSSTTALSATLAGYDTATNTATFTFDVNTFGPGRYTAVLPAGSVSDAAGNPLAINVGVPFNYQPGDVNGDGTVNFDDLLILAANYNTTPRTIDQGDLNYSGGVDFDDLLILAANYNVSLPTSAAPLALPDDEPTPGDAPNDVLA
jgi:GH25 family lysozyme M1 (1,4-beta-N-acetylmuramidase)